MGAAGVGVGGGEDVGGSLELITIRTYFLLGDLVIENPYYLGTFYLTASEQA